MKFTKFLMRSNKTLSSKLLTILAAFAFCLFWNALIILFYKWLYSSSLSEQMIRGQFWPSTPAYKHPFVIDLYQTCLLAPLAEEVLLRMLPIEILRKTKKSLMLPGILFCSVVFGYMHNGSMSLALQGVSGFVMAMVYIKNGYSYWSSVTVHFLWNLCLTVGLYNLLIH